MGEPVNAEQVPEELAESLARLLWQIDDHRGEHHQLIPDARIWLAANLPAHEALVRAKVAAEIEAITVMAPRNQSPAEAKADAYKTAASIARGDQ